MRGAEAPSVDDGVPANDAQSQREAPNALNEADEKLHSWFDGLGFPNLSNRQFVRLENEGWLESQGDTGHSFGFLLAEDEQTFQVFTLEFDHAVFRKTDEGPFGQPETNRYVALDLEQEASASLERMRDPDGEEPRSPLARIPLTRAQVVLLARACAGNRLPDLAHRLLVQAAAISSPNSGKPAESLEQMQDLLAEEIGHDEMWGNVLALGDPRVSRPELLKRFRLYAARFPRTSHTKRAIETARLLEQMVAEDSAHALAVRKPDEMMTVQERVAELIYQLCDQNGSQWSDPGSCDIFTDPRDGGLFASEERRRGKGSPATQLVALGYEAVPQLIEHLDDPRLTRSIQHWRSFIFSHSALTVGDCARLILEKIANRKFDAIQDQKGIRDEIRA